MLRVRQPEKFNLIEQFRGFSAGSNFNLRPFPKAYLEQVGEDIGVAEQDRPGAC